MISENFINAIRPLLKDEKELQAYLEAAGKHLNKSIKLVNFRSNPDGDYEEVLSKFKELAPSDWKLEPTIFQELKDQFYVDREDREMALGKSFLHLCGFFYMQEVAASLPANFLELPENSLVLDVCAAPGGKSVQLADRLLSRHDQQPGLVWSNDVDSKRIKSLGTNINRIGTYNNIVTQIDGTKFGDLFPEMFDAILIDAPCSGEGTFFKSETALQRWKEESINNIVGVQEQILTSAIKATKVGGSIVYSTCTLNYMENEFIVSKMLEKFGDALEIENVALEKKSVGYTHYGDLQLLTDENAQKIARCWPHIHGTGGFFLCKIKKVASVGTGAAEKVKEKRKNRKDNKNNTYNMDYDNNKKLTKEVSNYLFEQFGIEIDSKKYCVVASEFKIFLCSPKVLEILNKVPIAKIGIPILKKIRDDFRPLHGLGLVLGGLATKNVVTMDDAQMQEYIFNQDLDIVDGMTLENCKGKNGFVVIKRRGFGMSIAKRVGNTLKNKFLKWGK